MENKLYKAIERNKPIITVIAPNAIAARTEVIKQLSANPSRRAYKVAWREGHCALLTAKGVTIYWCHNMERYVTIPEDE